VGVNQERALNEMSGPSPAAPAGGPDYREHFELRPTQDGFVQFSVQLLEHKVIERSAMRAKPGKSALEGPVSVTATAEVANEILNEMQRERGGGTVMEDQSRYQVTVRIPGAKGVADWKGEMIGSPGLYPLKTVNVVAGGKSLTVLDKGNKKKWDASLTYEISEGAGSMDEGNAPFGLGPVVERNGALFVIDEGVLTAFDLATGDARWRLPSVGISGLFFDEDGNIYVNSTTAGPDRIKFARQIDITERVGAVVLKIDPKDGKILWTAEPGGQVSHVSGKNIFTINWYQPEDDEDNSLYMPDTGFETPPYMRIKRINPRNGRVMWEHFQQRAPLDVQFEGNTIRLVFKKELQVLKFLSL
jgi:outer membrane protein assembly factor BamB